MRYKRVLLCIPPLVGSAARNARYNDLPEMPFTGIGYLTELLQSHGIEVDAIDMRFGYGIRDLSNKIFDFKPDLVGFSMMTLRYDIIYDIMSRIQSKDYHIVVGGPHVSTMRTRVMEECKADYGVKLEGEYTLLELCNGKPLKDIMGLIYKNERGEIIENPDRPFIETLDEIPFPKYEKFELGRYADKRIPIVSSRGCPMRCIFCPVKIAIGREFRVRSAGNVIEELTYWYSRGYRKFSFLDDNFTLDKKRVYEICDLIETNCLRDLRLSCPNGVRADRVDLPLLKRMKEVGFYELCFGVESGNEKVLERMKKGLKLETIETAIKNACDLGYDVGLFLIVGLPGETPRELEDSIALAMKYPVNFANFYNIVTFPGTELHEWVSSNGLFLGDAETKLRYAAHYDREIYFETPEFKADERREALKRTAKISKKILKRNLQRKLSKFGIPGKLLTDIMYSDMFYETIRRNYQRKSIRRIVNFVMKNLKSDIHHF